MESEREIENDEREINELTQTLSELNILTTTLTRRRQSLLNRSRRRNARIRRSIEEANALRNRSFAIGDLVEVLDNYKGRRGIRGRVTEIHGAQVRIQPIDGRPGFRKFKENVRHIAEDE